MICACGWKLEQSEYTILQGMRSVKSLKVFYMKKLSRVKTSGVKVKHILNTSSSFTATPH